ncbi:MAG TPA: UDP-2,3-diacylglucosamine diphosphatase LpxI [Bacillota bacterium]|nr:UDP-2,3-diacylglucosamine diphosphatase LpxI [Bacillota bacterium]
MEGRTRIGLVAGQGNLPVETLKEMRGCGLRSFVVGLKGECLPQIVEIADDFAEVSVGSLGKMIEYFQTNGVTEIVMAGKVKKEALFKAEFDQVFQDVLRSLPEKNDDAILLGVVKAYEKNGIKVLKQTEYLQHLLAKPGALSGELSDQEMMDIKLGFRTAKAIGGLDIGQTVVVKHGVILAVEAIEGSDQAIIRGGSLGGPGTVVVKVSKPKQDERFDVPTVGMSTIESIAKVQGAVLGIEAEKTFVVDREQVLEMASRHNIKVYAV